MVERDDGLTPLEQLQAFADWEVKHHPGPRGARHIAQWAVQEIERLMAENAALRGGAMRVDGPDAWGSDALR